MWQPTFSQWVFPVNVKTRQPGQFFKPRRLIAGTRTIYFTKWTPKEVVGVEKKTHFGFFLLLFVTLTVTVWHSSQPSRQSHHRWWSWKWKYRQLICIGDYLGLELPSGPSHPGQDEHTRCGGYIFHVVFLQGSGHPQSERFLLLGWVGWHCTTRDRWQRRA